MGYDEETCHQQGGPKNDRYKYGAHNSTSRGEQKPSETAFISFIFGPFIGVVAPH